MSINDKNQTMGTDCTCGFCVHWRTEGDGAGDCPTEGLTEHDFSCGQWQRQPVTHRLKTWPPSGDEAEAFGRADYKAGFPCTPPDYGYEDRRARWRLGWRKEEARSAGLSALRREQTEKVMPLIGQLIDAWDSMPNDVKGLVEEQAEPFTLTMHEIMEAMEGRP